MNKYLFIIGFAGMALFSACSTSDELSSDIPIPSPGLTEEEKALIIEAGKDSDVPITLGSVANSRAATRSPLESTPFQIPDGKLSVYCLATDIQAGAPNISAIPGSKEDIKWDGSVTFANWLVNQPAIVSYWNGSGDSPIPGGSSAYSYIQFWKGSAVKERYYPFGNWYSYDFFAYYPRVGNDDTSYSESGKACFANISIDGSKDVIWAHASGAEKTAQESSTSPIVKAYSSKYIRLKKAESSEIDIVPEFEFKHLLSQFVFTIKPHPGDEKELHDKGFAVKGLKFTEIPTQLQLVVASKEENSHKSGDFEDLETPVTGNIQVWTEGTDADPFAGSSTILVATSESDQTLKNVGYAMVPPSKTINGTALVDEHTVTLEMKQTSGDAVPNTVVTLPPPAGGFLPGKIYHMEIEIFNPTKIQAKATLVGWEDVALPTVVPVH